ncbi:MAG TPA: hypothetical protein VKB79_07325 [Bryobacteraceae bacterium]|nr:hypothetical protein [Bryobacteraceae bacterium]
MTETKQFSIDPEPIRQRYKEAVEEWIKAIRAEEELVSAHPSIDQVDAWEHAHLREEESRTQAKKAKREYEDAVRRDFFGF